MVLQAEGGACKRHTDPMITTFLAEHHTQCQSAESELICTWRPPECIHNWNAGASCCDSPPSPRTIKLNTQYWSVFFTQRSRIKCPFSSLNVAWHLCETSESHRMSSFQETLGCLTSCLETSWLLKHWLIFSSGKIRAYFAYAQFFWRVGL